MRVGMVGCGNIAANHVVGFRDAGAEVVGCADVDAAWATGFAARHGFASAVPDVAALLDLGVGVVSVCTPTPEDLG